MNSRGLTFFYNLMLGTLIIVLGMALASPIKDFFDDARTNASCGTPESDWYDALCIFLDISKPMITGGIIFIGFAALVVGHKMGL